MSYVEINKFADDLNDRKIRSEEFFEVFLRSLGIGGYERNGVVEDTYIGDFVFRKQRFILEVYGGIHDEPAQRAKDEKRNQFLNQRRWAVYIVRYPIDEMSLLELINLASALHHYAMNTIAINISVLAEIRARGV